MERRQTTGWDASLATGPGFGGAMRRGLWRAGFGCCATEAPKSAVSGDRRGPSRRQSPSRSDCAWRGTRLPIGETGGSKAQGRPDPRGITGPAQARLGNSGETGAGQPRFTLARETGERAPGGSTNRSNHWWLRLPKKFFRSVHRRIVDPDQHAERLKQTKQERPHGEICLTRLLGRLRSDPGFSGTTATSNTRAASAALLLRRGCYAQCGAG